MSVCTGKNHLSPVHFNRGRHGSVWVCLSCGTLLAGRPIDPEEFAALIEYGKFLVDEANNSPERAKENGMKLELGIMAGPESKAFLVGFTKQIDRLEKLTGGKPMKGAARAEESEESETETETETETEADEDFGPATGKAAKAKAAAKKAAADFESEETEEETEEEFTAPAKTTKPKKLTVDDVNDACKAKVKALGGNKAAREKVLAVLEKKFGTKTVSDLEPEQYAACIKAMAV